MKKITLSLISLIAFLSFSHSQEWQTKFEQAKQLATEQNKAIVLVFQGSDWCAPCIKLDKEIWSQPEFKALAKDKLVMLKADFPRKKKNKLPQELQNQNNKLAELYNPQGHFPLAVVLNNKGDLLGKIGYKKIGSKAYFEKLISFTNN